MAYKEHPECQPSGNDRQQIWRYMDLWKLTELLRNNALYFSCLIDLDDPWEGYLSSATIDRLQSRMERNDVSEKEKRNIQRLLSIFRDARRQIHVNCWHMSEVESAGMWKIYAANGTGIAIQSNCRRFRNAFDVDDRQDVYVGVVAYADYAVDMMPFTNVLTPGLSKRLAYEYEQELRGILLNEGVERSGINVPVDVARLIERVVVAPGAPSHYEDALADLGSRYGVSLSVYRSELEAELPS